MLVRVPAEVRLRCLLGVSALLGFGLLTLAVALRATQPLDEAVRDLARPPGTWGPLQERADLVVEGFRPTVSMPAGLLVAVLVSAARRSVRPLVVMLLAGAAAGAVTLVVKAALGRPDPSEAVGHSHGGSFPSGHTVTLMLCVGLAVLLVRPGGRLMWAAALPAGAVMGACLIAEGAHWLTDVLGAALLAVAVLAVAASGPAWWAAGQRTSQAVRTADPSP